jgi:bacillithiol biosynthesis cysteine-adding enzyme BshC
MKVSCIDFLETRQFAPIFIDFIQQKEHLKPFYHRPPTIASFEEQIKEKANSEIDRQSLVKVLKEQYKSIELVDEVTHLQIESLEDKNTFTLTTGHQLNIFTGPLYFHYKIITVINACKKLKTSYPEYNFVPVYWMASEDHDLDEIKVIQVEGQKFKWATEQTGAVGRMHTDGLLELANTIDPKGKIFQKAYGQAKNLADATRSYVHQLYRKEGLVILDADDAMLKANFKDVIKDDILNHTANTLVNEQSTKLDGLGYKSQTYPREINFFYLTTGERNRIVVEDDHYAILDKDTKFTKSEILLEIEAHPERFSPNVILRPLYQEQILPNLSYTGGPAEVAYWMQLKPVFNHYNTVFPILLPRNFGLVIPNIVQHKLKKLKMADAEIFIETENLKKNITKKISGQKLHLNEERQSLNQLLDEIKQYAGEIDYSLSEMTAAETKKVMNSLDKIEKKMIAAEKRKYANKMRQIDEIKSYLYPSNGPQERKENFLPFIQADEKFIEKLIKVLDPFNLQFHLMRWNG